MIKNIAIIGAGQLGSRHLQALKKINFPILLEVVDNNSDSLSLAKQRYDELPNNSNISLINYYSSMDELNDDLDLCIIATNADIRAAVTKQLVFKKNVRNILFEKVLFQRIFDYNHIYDLLTSKHINAWVNFPRRYFPFYQRLKEILNKEESVSIHAQTGDSGIVTGSIHLLDLLVYLNHDSPVLSSANFLHSKMITTKRNGFFELAGTISFELENGARIILSSQEIPNSPNSIYIYSTNFIVIIDEENSYATIADKRNNWAKENIPFSVIYQSNLTNIVATDILMKGSCYLTNFIESRQIHLKFLEGLAETFNTTGDLNTVFPIT